MTTKKSPPTLSTLQSGIDELQITLKTSVRQLNGKFNKIDNKFDRVNQELKYLRGELSSRFTKQEQLFFQWKSDLFTKIDNGYAKPVKNLQDEVEILNTRTIDLRNRLRFPFLPPQYIECA